jgi:hypothetical protein
LIGFTVLWSEWVVANTCSMAGGIMKDEVYNGRTD